MAARALVPLIPSTSSLVVTIADLLKWDDKVTQNDIHGRLMQVQFLLRCHLYQGTAADATLLELVKSLSGVLVQCLLAVKQLNPISQALLLDIISEFCLDCKWIHEDKSAQLVDGKKSRSHIYTQYITLTHSTFTYTELLSVSDESFESLRGLVISYCSEATRESATSERHIGTYLARQSMANVVVLAYLNFGIGELPDIMYLLDDPDYEVRLLAMSKLMEHFDKMEDTNTIPG
jgi:hypothetical protein